MEGQAVTTNPWLIMAINMTVVFVVLILLGILMTIVHLIDPTKKKKDVPPKKKLLKLTQLLQLQQLLWLHQVHLLKMRMK